MSVICWRSAVPIEGRPKGSAERKGKVTKILLIEVRKLPAFDFFPYIGQITVSSSWGWKCNRFGAEGADVANISAMVGEELWGEEGSYSGPSV